jgi:hypothetical protein
MPRRGAYLHVNLCEKFELPPLIYGFAYYHEDARRCKRILALVQAELGPEAEVRCILARDLADSVLRVDGYLKDVEKHQNAIADLVLLVNQCATAYATELEAEDAQRQSVYKRGAYIYLDVGQGMRIPYDPYGFIFYHESERVVREIAYAASDWYYGEGAICNVLTGREVGLQYVEADEWIEFNRTDSASRSMQKCVRYADDLFRAFESRPKRGKRPAKESRERVAPVTKLDGWTKQELISQAKTEWEGFSGSTFDRIRDAAEVAGGPKGGRGAHHRYSTREVSKLIDGAERRGRELGNAEYALVASAWRQLIPHDSSATNS